MGTGAPPVGLQGRKGENFPVQGQVPEAGNPNPNSLCQSHGGFTQTRANVYPLAPRLPLCTSGPCLVLAGAGWSPGERWRVQDTAHSPQGGQSLCSSALHGPSATSHRPVRRWGSVPIPHPWLGLHLRGTWSLPAPRVACLISTHFSPPQLPAAVWPRAPAPRPQTGPAQRLGFARGLPAGRNARPLALRLQTRTSLNILGKGYLLSAFCLS